MSGVRVSIVLALTLCCSVWRIEAARILGFFPSQSKSKLLVHCAVADALQKAGHEVVVFGTMPNVYPTAQYKYYHFNAEGFSLEYLTSRPLWRQYLSRMAEVAHMGSKYMHDKELKSVLKEEGEIGFDLVILGYFLNDFHLGLGGQFRCPIIVSSTEPPTFATNAMVGNPHEIAYVPSHLSGLTQPMGFGQRFWNYFISMYEQLWVRFWMDKTMREYYKLHFECGDCPTFDQVRKNISLVFVNHHFTQGPIRPNVPAIVEIGGIHIDEHVHQLPDDIDLFLSQATKGVVYASFGSNISCDVMSANQAKHLYNAFAQLPYKVLWRWDVCPVPGSAENILYKNWFPQNDVLAHPKVRLFVTHGGQGSMEEAQYHGVPMLGVPFFGDQPANVQGMVEKGFGLALNYQTMSPQNIADAIRQLMDNRAYTDAVQKFSELYRDRPQSPRQAVVYWTNYVLRYGGAKHMQSPAADMHFWQLWNADVNGVLLFFVTGVLLAICKSPILCRKVGPASAQRSPDSPSQLTPQPPAPRPRPPIAMQARGRSQTPAMMQLPPDAQPLSEIHAPGRRTPQLQTTQVQAPDFEPFGDPIDCLEDPMQSTQPRVRAELQVHAELHSLDADMYRLDEEPDSSYATRRSADRSPNPERSKSLQEFAQRLRQGQRITRRHSAKPTT